MRPPHLPRGCDRCSEILAAGAVQHGDGAAVLAPAGDVVADRDRALLAVGDGLHAVAGDALGDQKVARGGGAAGAERQVIFARAALVGMAFDGDGVVAGTG